MFKLIAIGDNNIDTYAASGVSYPGGNCPNVAAYAAINGYPSAYIGVAGLDSFGDLLAGGLAETGVDVSHLRRERGITSRDVIVSREGDRTFTQYDRSIIDAFPLCFDEGELDYIRSFDLIHTSIYSTFAPGAFDLLCGLGVPVSYDFSVEWQQEFTDQSGEEYLQELTPLPPDFLESVCKKVDYAFFSCSNVSEEETDALLRRAVGFGCRLAVGTRGMHGSFCFDGHGFYRQDAYRTSVVDTLGAGDSFITRFLLTYLDGARLLEHCTGTLPAQGGFLPGDLGDYRQKLVRAGLSQAALFAARSCQVEGAFGHGRLL